MTDAVHRSLLLVLLLVTALSSATRAQVTGGSAQTGTIQGTVTETTTGDPIAGVRVTISGSQYDPQAMNTFLQHLAGRGVSITAPSGPLDEKALQSVLDLAAAGGASPVFPATKTALETLRASGDKP